MACTIIVHADHDVSVWAVVHKLADWPWLHRLRKTYIFLTAREFMSRHNITHFSVRSLQSKSPAAKVNDCVDIVDVLNFHNAVQGHSHVDLPSFRGHCVCMVFFLSIFVQAQHQFIENLTATHHVNKIS